MSFWENYIVLFDYAVSEDGTTISLGVQVSSSMGYVRGFKDDGGGVKPHYLTFYNTFGGLNRSFGAVSTFVRPVNRFRVRVQRTAVFG